MSQGNIQDPSEFFSTAIENAIYGAIEDQVRQKMPEIVAAACANIAGNASSYFNLERMGSDLRITVLNAYKPTEPHHE